MSVNSQVMKEMQKEIDSLYVMKKRQYERNQELLRQIQELEARELELKAMVNRQAERLMIERRQLKEIRAYTQDGGLACICADHEDCIGEMLKEAPEQSLATHDLEVRDKVIEECIKQMDGMSGYDEFDPTESHIEAIRNLKSDNG